MRIIFLDELPPCDICRGVLLGQNNPNATLATHDSPTLYGPWANLCDRHFKSCGRSSPYAIKLALKQDQPKQKPQPGGSIR